MDLVTEIYKVSQKFPKEEIFGLVRQLRRAAVSIPSNIAEGQSKSSTGELKSFLGHAKGSLSELETQIFIAKNLNFLSESEADNLLILSSEVGRILNGLLSALRKK